MIANFSATWCGPCKMIAPFYRELSEKFPALVYLTVDVDELAVSTVTLKNSICLKLLYIHVKYFLKAYLKLSVLP